MRSVHDARFDVGRGSRMQRKSRGYHQALPCALSRGMTEEARAGLLLHSRISRDRDGVDCSL